VAVLNTTVHVHVDGKSVAYGPDVEIPADIARLILNPKVWVGGLPGVEPSEGESDPDKGEGESEETVPVEKLPIPPKGGSKATTEAWAAYAKQEIAARELSIDIPADASRKDIIEALEAAEIPTGE
jgi:hypothetical protein